MELNIFDYFLRASSKEEMFSLLEKEGLVSSCWENNLAEEYAIDAIGQIPGVEGYHLNLRSLYGEKEFHHITPLILDPPATPHTVWA